jgi:hypothetical protein
MKYWTIEAMLNLDIEQAWGKPTRVLIEIEYETGAEMANDFTVLLPCQHDINCQNHRLVLNEILTSALRKQVYELVDAAVVALKEIEK